MATMLVFLTTEDNQKSFVKKHNHTVAMISCEYSL